MAIQPAKHRPFIVRSIGIALLILGVLIVCSFMVFQPRDTAPVVDVSRKSVGDKTPALSARTVIGGLDHPWEIAFLPQGTMLITERSGDISVVKDGLKKIVHHPDDVYARGEGGMLGLAVDPDFTNNRFIYTCFNSQKGPDVRVVRWQLDSTVSSLTNRRDIITGLPSAGSGRHSGCRLGFGADGNVWVGTGDAADGAHPQSLLSLGGKILRVDRDGTGVADTMNNGADARIYSYGHRNTQGLAFYKEPRNGSYGVSIEHGPNVNDEVNALIRGNFGWAPGLPYNENVPMTDTMRFPDAVKSMWSSGNATIAPSDADFLVGEEWGKWQGWLAMGVLKDKHLRLLELKNDGTTGEQLRLFDHQFGRMRAVTMHDGSLYISTDNGNNQDSILRITPDL